MFVDERSFRDMRSLGLVPSGLSDYLSVCTHSSDVIFIAIRTFKQTLF